MAAGARLRNRVVIAALLWLAWSASALAQALPERLQGAIARIDAMAAAEHAKDDIGSLTIGAVAGGRLAWARSYGFADMEEKTPATVATVYRVGSITKAFTGLMLLQLAQDGKASLSDPVDRYFPELERIPNRPAARITLEQLATMTSGLAREPANSAAYSKGRVSDWEGVLLAALSHARYESAPGVRYLYSNIGYAVLGAALARAAGMPYVRYVHDRILVPLDMKETVLEPTDAMRPRIAKGYQVTRAGEVSSTLPLQQHDGRGYRVPNGALYSTVADMARFVVFALGEGPDSVLRKEVLDETFAKLSWDTAHQGSGYGIGMQVRRTGHLVVFGHDGDVPGYVANVRFDRVSKTGVIVLRSANGGRFDRRELTYRTLEEIARP